MLTNINSKAYDIMASRQSRKILTGTLSAVETFKNGDGKELECAVIFYDVFKVLIPLKHMSISREDKRVVRSMIGAEIDFIVKEIDERNKIAAASRTEAMELRKSLELKKHKVGDKISVRVTSVGRENCRVDCYGIETKVPINEIDYGYIDDISKFVKIGTKLQAVIKELDLEKDKIKVSIKEAKEDPYEQLIKSITKGGEYLGVVTGVQEYGVFFNIRKGVDCLCPFPNWTNFAPAIGEKYVVRIKNIDYKERKIDANIMRSIR
ncbi:S1 RNA-binding domain-containing protein [Clostridium felsineum]|uniref:S1 RNA-binding domain-containing protein n=1 Tax=Clostridium felsineum TaxID=36839 RepID=UPI00214D41AF|nr:S1 RNA-binding domain-containing protein [Clostridium felsineum]MCR3758465.1 S1 RNA-binding domain-containing protein [Clostridium felsineum]